MRSIWNATTKTVCYQLQFWSILGNSLAEIILNLGQVIILVTVDHYSNYTEVDSLENMSSTVVTKSKAVFCHRSVLEVNLTDNGPQYSG